MLLADKLVDTNRGKADLELDIAHIAGDGVALEQIVIDGVYREPRPKFKLHPINY